MTDSVSPDDVHRDDPPSANEDVAKLRLKLNHLTIEELEEKGLVKWDREEHVVRKGPNFDAKNTG